MRVFLCRLLDRGVLNAAPNDAIILYVIWCECNFFIKAIKARFREYKALCTVFVIYHLRSLFVQNLAVENFNNEGRAAFLYNQIECRAIYAIAPPIMSVVADPNVLTIPRDSRFLFGVLSIYCA